MRLPERYSEILAAVAAVAILVLIAEVARSLPSLSPLPAVTEPAAAPSPSIHEVRRFQRRRRLEAQKKIEDASKPRMAAQSQGREPSKTPSIDPGHSDPTPASQLHEPHPAAKTEAMGPPPPPETWTEAEVKTGRMDCDRRLSGLHVAFVPLDPIKQGACGTPAPIRLEGFDFGKEPRLSVFPGATMSCKLAEALQRWFEDVVQPKAKQHLQASIVRVTDLSAYQCRPRYDDPGQRISEHAYANAIDLSEFVTAKGEHVAVADHWSGNDERSSFLHEIHDGACEIFGTTLGPEANEAHKNHFHLDMKERRKPLCDFTPQQERAKRDAAALKSKEAGVKVPVSSPVQDRTPAPKPSPVPAAAAPDNAPTMNAAEPLRTRKKNRHRGRGSFRLGF